MVDSTKKLVWNGPEKFGSRDVSICGGLPLDPKFKKTAALQSSVYLVMEKKTAQASNDKSCSAILGVKIVKVLGKLQSLPKVSGT